MSCNVLKVSIPVAKSLVCALLVLGFQIQRVSRIDFLQAKTRAVRYPKWIRKSPSVLDYLVKFHVPLFVPDSTFHRARVSGRQHKVSGAQVPRQQPEGLQRK
jgi:hypothetical protein